MYYEVLKYIAGWVMFLLAIIILSIFAGYYSQKIQCLSKYESYSPEFSLFGGCKIMWSGKMTPIDIVREIE